jgi:hypothetical protein
MESAAASLGWATERAEAPYNNSLYNDALPLALRVWIEPPVPLGKIDHSVFQFDEQGCLSPR